MSLFSHYINASEIPQTKTAVNSDKGTHAKKIIVMIITRFELFLAATIKKLHNVCVYEKSVIYKRLMLTKLNKNS